MKLLDKTMLKRLSAAALVFVMLLGMLPAVTLADGENFVIQVVNEDGDPVENATVAYTVTVNGSAEIQESDGTNAAGELTLDLSVYATEIASNQVTISYTVTADGYVTESADDVAVTAADGTLPITLEEDTTPPATATLTVSQTNGTGTVLLDGEEQTSVTVNSGDKVEVSITPDDTQHIKAITVDGVSVIDELDEDGTYTATLTVDADLTVAVTYVTFHTVSGNVTGENFGTVEFCVGDPDDPDAQWEETLDVDEGEWVTARVTPDEGYQISQVFLDNLTGTTKLDPSGSRDGYTYNFVVSAATGDVTLTASFERIYVVTLTIREDEDGEGDGTITTTPVGASVGKVTTVVAKENQSVTFTATPAVNYRVAAVSVSVDDDEAETEDFSDNMYSAYQVSGDTHVTRYIRDLESNHDYDVTVTFALRVYDVDVTTRGAGHGTARVDGKAKHGKSKDVVVVPDEGYTLDDIKVNGVSKKSDVIPAEDEEGSNLTLTIPNITDDVDVEVSYKPLSGATQNGDEVQVSYDLSVALRSYTVGGSNVYVLRKDASVVFTSTAAIRLVFSDGSVSGGLTTHSVTVSESKVVTQVQFYDTLELGWRGVALDLSSALDAQPTLSIVIDKTAPAIILTPDTPHYNGYYNHDFRVAFSVLENENGAGIKSISYWYGDDPGTVVACYDAAGVGVMDHENENGIKVTAVYHNSADVKLYFQVTDHAGNTRVVTTGEDGMPRLDVNCTAPQAQVTMSDSFNPGTADSQFTKRIATITIHDRSDTFDKDALSLSISAKVYQLDDDTYLSSAELIDAPEAVSAVLDTLEWTSEDDVNGIYTAQLTFTANAHFTWSIRYTNKAGASALTTAGDPAAFDGTQPPSPTQIAAPSYATWAFAVDNIAPKGRVSAGQKGFWDEIVETLTFNLFYNSDIPVETTVGDTVSGGACTVAYYKIEKPETMLTLEQLKALDNSQFLPAPLSLLKSGGDKTYVVYAKLTDLAGNVSYIGTDGLMLDATAPALTVSCLDAANSAHFFNHDVTIKVTTSDPKSVNALPAVTAPGGGSLPGSEAEDVAANALCSGVKTVSYELIHRYKDDAYTVNPDVVSSVGPVVIYSLDDGIGDLDDLTFTVSAEDNNFDDVQVVVTVTDQAGNVMKNVSEGYDQEELHLSFSTNRPKINVEMQEDPGYQFYIDGIGYTNVGRTAALTVTARQSVFDPQAATSSITIRKNGVALPAATAAGMIRGWEDHINRSAPETTTHTATIVFPVEQTAVTAEDGTVTTTSTDVRYDWSVDYTDLAGNTCRTEPEEDDPEQVVDLTYVTDQHPFAFVIDPVAPTANVTSSDGTVWPFLSQLLAGLKFPYQTKTVDIDLKELADNVFDPDKISVTYLTTARELTGEELVGSTFSHTYAGPITLPYNAKTAVYFKLVDKVGNTSYLCSNGYAPDNVAPSLSLSPPSITDPDQHGIYNIKDGDFEIRISAGDNFSGVSSVSYVVTCNGVTTQQGKSRTITIDSKRNNSCDVVVTAKASDSAGNHSSRSVALDIDVSAPEVDLTFDNNQDNGGNGYFNKPRTATLVITERDDHFEPEVATAGIAITAVDINGKEVANAYRVSEWTTKTNSSDSNLTTHTATIAFEKDANYTFAFAYTDKAGNPSSEIKTHDSAAPFAFTVDSSAPVASVQAVSAEGRTESWDSLIRPDDLTFGFWSGQKISITATSQDDTSPVTATQYYKVASTNAKDGTTALTAQELDQIKDWEDFSKLDISSDEQFTVYLRFLDKAGNCAYLSTNGLIVDTKSPRQETIAPVITVTPEQPINGIYNGNVAVDVKVVDPLAGGAYSGLKTVSYKVFDRAVSDTVPTQEGDLFVFNSANPRHRDLTQEWTDTITVDSTLNNSNQIQVVVYASDNALNTSMDSVNVQIDTTAPVIRVSYDNNAADSERYFRNVRTAFISVTERNFDPEDVVLSLTSTGQAPVLTDWVTQEAGGNGDETVHTASLAFTADADYDFDIACLDRAGNPSPEVVFAEDTVSGSEFTVDRTIPVIRVSFDNNNVLNGNYYNAERTATLTVVEHNFSPERVQANLTQNGSPTAPALSWSHNGDTHSASIRCNNDVHYVLNMSYTDLAGNPAQPLPTQDFYVDTTPPEIQVEQVVDFTAYDGEIAPVVTCRDANFDADQFLISLQRESTKALVSPDGSYMSTRDGLLPGQIFRFNNFAETKETDDIYTLTVHAIDKAGHESEEVRVFSVNRFGSNYQMSEHLAQINGSYVQEAGDVVFSEINATKLSNIRLTLHKNDQTIELTEGTDYYMSWVGGEGKWYEYTYTVLAANFTDDGLYRLSVYSKDENGNESENSYVGKNTDISFIVDNTAPIVNMKNLSSNVTYAEKVRTVEFSVLDNLRLSQVDIYLDDMDTPYITLAGEDLAAVIADGGNYRFDISGDSTRAHTLKVVATDAAGNTRETVINNFYVTTNLWVRYYTNKPLFYGSIVGAVGAVAGGVYMVLRRRKTTAGDDDDLSE